MLLIKERNKATFKLLLEPILELQMNAPPMYPSDMSDAQWPARAAYRSHGPMYPSDMSDAQWQVLAKHFAEMNKRARPRVRIARDLINAIFYVQATDG